MKTKILEQLKQRPMRVVTLCMRLGVEYREIEKHIQKLRKDGAIRFDKKAGWQISPKPDGCARAQTCDEAGLYADAADREKSRAESAEARVRELEATDRIPADVEKRNTWAKRIVDERDAAQEAAGSAERRLGELEAEMKECSEVRAKLAVDLAEYQLRQPALEAQCAAMREALVKLWIPFDRPMKQTVERALSGDAGRALLERVEALERVVEEVRASIVRPESALGEAMAALDALETMR